MSVSSGANFAEPSRAGQLAGQAGSAGPAGPDWTQLGQFRLNATPASASDFQIGFELSRTAALASKLSVSKRSYVATAHSSAGLGQGKRKCEPSRLERVARGVTRAVCFALVAGRLATSGSDLVAARHTYPQAAAAVRYICDRPGAPWRRPV